MRMTNFKMINLFFGGGSGGGRMNLKEFVEKYPQFKKVFNFLKEYLEEKPENIKIYSFKEAAKQGFRIRETVEAFVVKPDKVYFRHIPPDLYTFTHELIHLCKKDNDIEEEVYAYNLVEAVIYVAENDIKANIFKLFNLTRKDIEKVLKELGFSNIEEFYQVLGVIPTTHTLIPSENGLKIVQKEGVAEKHVVIMFITEIIGGLKYDYLCEKVFQNLLTLLK